MNFFSNTSRANMSFDHIEQFFSQKILEKLHFINFQNSEIGDPIVKLLEDIKTRKIKLIIPSEDEILPYLKNDSSIRKSVSVPVNLKKMPIGIEKPTRFPPIFTNQRSPNFPTSEQKVLLQKLKKIPVYTVVTNKNEMVMAMSRDPYENNVLNWVYKKYYNAFVWTEDEGPISVGLFFMNKEDAQLYLHEIVNAEPKMAEKSEIEVKMIGLDAFYKLNRTSPPGQQAKLIADLEEIEQIIQNYIPKANHSIHPNQKYTKIGYKGTPIYKIKPIIIQKKHKKVEAVHYKIKNIESKNYVFFRLQDAYSAWDKFCTDNKNLKLPLYPEVEIYNLENYLNELEHSSEESIKNISFVSTQDSFKNLKLQTEGKIKKSPPPLSKNIKRLVLDKFKNFQSLSKKIFWVLTSDTLPTEKNAW